MRNKKTKLVSHQMYDLKHKKKLTTTQHSPIRPTTIKPGFILLLKYLAVNNK